MLFNIGLALLYNFCPKRRTEGDRSKIYVGLLAHYPLLLSDFNET
jgi:hypothetical protein